MKKYRVESDSDIRLSEIDPDDRSEFAGDKAAAKRELSEVEAELDKLQERLYAEGTRAVLFVIQAMDTGGKDGTIRNVFGNLNPAGCYVASFKAPTTKELAHDYLWRVHAEAPRRGKIGIFNRSHYEDVLIVRVHHLVPKKFWEKRYDHINAFEKMLTDEGTTIVKFFLHISKDEQKKRLQARLDNPEKHWKFNVDDLKERALWDDYQEAYQDALNKTSTKYAPWYVIPANRKWYRNIIVARIVEDTLKRLDPKFPEKHLDVASIVIE
jgi:PPK2 family polyphosphate:nucleotide phosphotransferase